MNTFAKLYEEMENEPEVPESASNIFEHKQRQRAKIEQLGLAISAQYNKAGFENNYSCHILVNIPNFVEISKS